jgi:pimeloyl-ACP methyl ester carboxylesterase
MSDQSRHPLPPPLHVPPLDAAPGSFMLPWLPEGRVVALQGRGEVFLRVHRHPDPDAPTLMLLHGWTATADVQFFAAYPALAERFSFVAIDHRGHGRGIRSAARFTLEDAADDAAAALEHLGTGPVVAVGYSMGGPISMLLARRHPTLVSGLVVQATALEWSGTRMERLTWLWLPALGSAMRSWVFPRYFRRVLRRVVPDGHVLDPYVPWIFGESQRGNPHALVDAGRALRHYDARPWASALGVPAAMLVTTRDHLVRPRKQRQLATALGARVHELAGDHFCSLAQPGEFATTTIAAVDSVVGEIAARRAGSAGRVA